MRVSKWGNSLAIRLPTAVVGALGLQEGDDVMLRAVGKRMLEIEKAAGAKELLARLRRFRGRLPRGAISSLMPRRFRSRALRPDLRLTLVKTTSIFCQSCRIPHLFDQPIPRAGQR